MEDPLEETHWMDFHLCCMFVTAHNLSTEVKFKAWNTYCMKTEATSYTLETDMKRKQHLFEKENYLANLHILRDPVSPNNEISWGTNKVYSKTNHFYFSLFGQEAFQGRTYSGTENWVDDVFSFTPFGIRLFVSWRISPFKDMTKLRNFRGVIFPESTLEVWLTFGLGFLFVWNCLMSC